MNDHNAKPTTQTDVAVIGAGIVGINCALALAREGFSVSVIDRAEPGEGCSFGNAGLLSPWSFVPIFGPDVLPNIPRYLADPLGPLTIRWTRLPQILPWLMRMLAKANTAHLQHAAGAMSHLTLGCGEAYAELAREAGVPDLIRQETILQVYDRQGEFEKAEKDFAQRAAYGIRYEPLDRAALHDLEPELGEDFQWAHALYGGARTVNPERLVKALASAFAKRGGKFHKGEVNCLRHDPTAKRAFTIEAGETSIDAEKLVIAAGAFSHKLSSQIGDRIPLGTERGYHAVIAEPGIDIRHSVGWKARGFFASPMEMGLRIAGTVELAGLDAAPNYARSDVLAKLAGKMFPRLNQAITSRWMGFRPTLPDSMPVIGPSKRAPGAYYAFGHQHIGMACGPATGRVVAGLIKGTPPNFDLEPFSAYRF